MVAWSPAPSSLLLLAACTTCLPGLQAAADVGFPGWARPWLSQRAAQGTDMYLPWMVDRNSTCWTSLQVMLEALTHDNTSWWAAKMVDSWSKVPDGMLLGNLVQAGVYDECVRTSSPDHQINGKFCRVYLMPKPDKDSLSNDIWHFEGRRPRLAGFLPAYLKPNSSFLSFAYGTCMPDTCSKHQLQDSVSAALNQTLIFAQFVDCQTLREPNEYLPWDITYMTLMSILLLLMAAASTLDVYIEKSGNTVIGKGRLRYLLPFSLYTNVAQLFQLNTTKSSKNITCLHGIRVLSMTWVIYGHQHETISLFSTNAPAMYTKTTGFWYQILFNAYFSVDSFFLLSGFLVTYVLLRELALTGRFNIIVFYVHRFLRLAPPIAIYAGLIATVSRYCVSGPLADSWEYFKRGCMANWWKDVTFINNYFLEDDDIEAGYDCLPQTWYLAVDTQLYLVAPLVILPLHYSKAGKAWLYVMTIGSIITPATIAYAFDLAPSSLLWDPKGEEYFAKIYVTPWCRAGPWLAGVWLGYIFHKQGADRPVLKSWQVVIGWTLAAFTAFLLLFGMWSYNTVPPIADYEVMTQIAYNGLSRHAWGAALAWVIYACHYGYGGFIDDFLSYPSWQPLSRITYSTYLVAMQMQYYITYSNKAPSYITAYNTMIQAVAAVVMSSALGMLLSLVSEAPVIGLEKLLLRRPNPDEKAKTQPQGQDNAAFAKEMEEVTTDKLEELDGSEGEEAIETKF